MMTDEQKRIEFFIKVREKFEDIEDLAKEYGVEEDYMSILCVGLLEEQEDDGRYKVNAISSIFVDNESEMASLMTHLAATYSEEDGPNFGDPDYWIGGGGDA
jgi:hypothetical protein